MDNKKIRIGLVGVANHGATILQAILNANNLELISCYDINRDVLAEVEKRYKIPGAKNFNALVQDTAIDAVALSTPNHLHLEQVRAAAGAGKHVFLEKPIANTVQEGKEIIRLMNNAGCILSVGHNARRKRTFRKAKELLDNDAIGKVVGIEANLSRPAGLQEALPQWKTDSETCPLLPMMQLGIHFVDTISYLVSPVRSVSCIAGTVAMNDATYDSSAALLHLESGVPAALSSYYVTPEVYYLKLYGTVGSIYCGASELRLLQTKDYKQYTVTNEDYSDEGMESYILEMTEFGECILKNKESETSGIVGLNALAVIEGMVQSFETGKSVLIKDILQ